MDLDLSTYGMAVPICQTSLSSRVAFKATVLDTSEFFGCRNVDWPSVSTSPTMAPLFASMPKTVLKSPTIKAELPPPPQHEAACALADIKTINKSSVDFTISLLQSRFRFRHWDG